MRAAVGMIVWRVPGPDAQVVGSRVAGVTGIPHFSLAGAGEPVVVNCLGPKENGEGVVHAVPNEAVHDSAVTNIADNLLYEARVPK